MEAPRTVLEYAESVVLGYLWLVYFLAQLANYCGLNVNFPPKLICLSTGSLASRTVWVPGESLGGGVMLEEVGHRGQIAWQRFFCTLLSYFRHSMTNNFLLSHHVSHQNKLNPFEL